jgi:DNA polymerase-3 subunit beta
MPFDGQTNPFRSCEQIAMKFAIERNALLKSLSHVQAIVERRTTIPILSNVRLRASGEELELAATDMDISLIAREPASIEEAGETTVNAHMLFEIIRKLPDGTQAVMQQSGDSNELSIQAGRASFDLPCLASEEFPSIGASDLDIHFSMPAPELAKMIDKTRFAISTEETRYYLNGIHMHIWHEGSTSMMRAVATDGHRLARAETGMPDGAETMPGIIVPRKTISEMRKLLGDLTDNVDIAVSSRRIQMNIDRAVLSSRLIDGTFPDYERVIPSNNDISVNINRAELAMAVDRVATVSQDKARAVKLSFASGKVALSAISSDTARAFEEIDCEYEGEKLEIGFNARYMLDMLECIESENVTLQLADPASPTIARDPENGAVLFVLMPMRV